MDTMLDIVEEILRTIPQTRTKNDGKLFFHYLDLMGIEVRLKDNVTGVSILAELNRLKMVTRARRTIQNTQGKYRAPPSVEKKRAEKAEEMSKWAIDQKDDEENEEDDTFP